MELCVVFTYSKISLTAFRVLKAKGGIGFNLAIEFLNVRAFSKTDSFSSAEVNMLKDMKFMQNQAQLLSEKLERLKQSLTIKNVGKQHQSNEERSKTEKAAYNLQKLLESQNSQIDALRIDLNSLL
uniref:Uncharacterized protein n=1 Tax=Romanomermis culicivorax TaxID=13658 RepID=A0A915JT71_ROMCU